MIVIFTVIILGRYAYFDRETHSLKLSEGYFPKPAEDEVLLRVLTCGICRTGNGLLQILIPLDLHVIDCDLPDSIPNVIPGII